ncbi:helix-turn-helix transcriptional regulator [Kordiimonas pumila]|uniref:Helix-turn-helix domain-containing protein n=1 Tax=Kordiimonas pumila TaxID=2161677 RepID=A0ABV7D397_9PROT|nr:AraC family transcriptional regulator [Kordiimonas pumila]
MTQNTSQFVPQSFTSLDRIMWITPDRLFYAGLLGAPCKQAHGAIVAHVAIDGLLHIRLDGGEWQKTEVAIIQPQTPYEISCEGRHVLNVLIEPETVDMNKLPPFLQGYGAIYAPEFATHVRKVHSQIIANHGTINLHPTDFDLAFFSKPLPPRALDQRIASVLENIRDNPSDAIAATEYASQANLSFSRFLHLFKEQVGLPFRKVRTWKRARSLLHHVHTDINLVYVALDIGYPDSTHFSHSIRQVYGLTPRDIIAGSRKLRVIAHAP